MWCRNFKSTISTGACMRRQSIARQNFVTTKTRIKENVYHYRQASMPESFNDCLICKQGKLVEQNPNRFYNDDIAKISKDQMNEIAARGYVHKESPPINIESLIIPYNIEKIELNYLEGKYHIDMDLIARISTYTIKRRNLNGESVKLVICGTNIRITDRSIRIIRYLYKQGHFARSKQIFLQSIGICFATARFTPDIVKIK